ncbi:MAG: hypothetical protein Q8M98_00985 [Candidatus Cloacimonadaceae bacterium]|nr:hypothetical protein [Candidatus Cloacimonadaceae bacterium]
MKKKAPVLQRAPKEMLDAMKEDIDLSYRRKNGYVMMLDVLGFREFVTKRHDIDFFDIWKSIKVSINKKKDEIQNRFDGRVNIDFLCLSDTLIETVQKPSPFYAALPEHLENKWSKCFHFTFS